MRRHQNRIFSSKFDQLYPYDPALNRHNLGPGQLTINEWQQAGLREPNMTEVRQYRLQRIRQQLIKNNLMGVLLYDPLNIRYATDTTNMQLWTTHNAARYCFVAADGPMILFDYAECEHLNVHNPLIDEIRIAKPWFYFSVGPNFKRDIQPWGQEIAELVKQYGQGNSRLAIDKVNPEGSELLNDLGVQICNAEEIMEHARLIKCEEEIQAMRCGMVSSEIAVEKMYQTMTDGITENHLWSVLHAENIKRSGEWIETRLLTSGARTNPWMQESSSKKIKNGEILAFDTDLIGVYGICIDISRSWIVGALEASKDQAEIHTLASEQIQHNIQLLRPSLSFKDFSKQAYTLPLKHFRRYGMLAHAVGLCDEYPAIPFPDRWQTDGFDGQFEAGMVICIESFVGKQTGGEGVKLEEQILITDNGHQKLSNFPLGLNPYST